LSQIGADHVLFICTTCKAGTAEPYLGLGLIAGLAAADSLPAGFQVIGTACMSGCTRPCTAAFRAPGKATYMFGDLDPATDVPALAEFAHTYVARPDGQTRMLERPKLLRRKTMGRIPPMPGLVSS